MIHQLKLWLKSDGLFSQSVIYTFFNVLSRAVPFLLIPFLTAYLTEEDYGLVAMFLLVVNGLSAFIGVNTVGAVDRAYFDEDIKDFYAYVGSCLHLLLYSIGGVLLLLFLFEEQLVYYTRIPALYVYLAGALASGQYLIRVLLSVWRVTNNAVSYGVFSALLSLVDVLGSVGLIYFFLLGWEGRVEGRLIAYTIFGIIALAVLIIRFRVPFALNKKYARHALLFGFPLIPHVLGGLAMSMTDRLFITNMVGLDKTGLYSVAYQLGTVLLVLTSSFNVAYGPWLYRQLNLKEAIVNHKIVRLTYGYFLVVWVVVLLLYFAFLLFSDFLLGDEFAGSMDFVLWILAGFAFNGMYFMVTNFIFYAKKTYALTIIAFVLVFINIPLTYYLVQTNGALGAAQATTILNGLLFVLAWIASNRVYSMPWGKALTV